MAVTLSPKQKRAWAESTHFINVWDGSVSGGKTFTWILAMLHKIQNAPAEGDIVIMGFSLPSIYRNVFSLIESHPLFAPFREHIRYNHNADTAVMFGRVVHVIGMGTIKASDRIRGMTIRYAFVDEGTLMPHEVFTMLLTRLRVPGAQCFITTNPGNQRHYLLTDYIQRPRETDTYHITFTMADNPGLPPEYVERQKSLYTGVFYQRFILGRWVAAEGAVFQGWNEDTMTVDTLPELLQTFAVGVDYGTEHPTAGYALSLGRDGDTYRLYLHNEWSPNPTTRATDYELATSFEEWTATLPHWPQFMYADPAAASFREELLRRNITTHRADNKVLDGIRTVDSLLMSDQLKIHADCTRLVEMIPGYVWDAKAAERGEDKPVKERDDEIDAARYTIFSSRHLWRPLLTAPTPTPA